MDKKLAIRNGIYRSILYKRSWCYGNKLHAAVIKNDLTQVELLLSQGKINVDSKDWMKRTPLNLAAILNKDESHFKIAETLLKNGANINATHKNCETPLFCIVRGGTLKMVKFFLNLKADVRTADHDMKNGLLFAASHNDKNMDVLQFLIDMGCDLNQRNYLEATVLHWILRGGMAEYVNFKMIKVLLKVGADLTAFDLAGNTPLMFGFTSILTINDFETVEKKLIFLMEHTDLNVIFRNVHVLNFEWIKPEQDYSWKMIIKHLAKLQILDVPVHQIYLDTISRRKEFKDYFKLCHEEMLVAKSTKIQNFWVSYYNLLVDNRKKIKNYAGNKDLIENFEKSDCVKKFPIYGVSMSENVKKGIKRRELFDKSSVLLSQCLPIFDSTHLIIYDIFNCIMSKKDLSTFCE